MEKSTVMAENPPLKHLRSIINELISDYEYVHKLLNGQLQALIHHDMSSLNKLVEEQVDAYEKLKKSELRFKEQLQAVHHVDSSGELTLNHVLQSLEKPSRTLDKLRYRLKEQVEKTEKLRRQLVDLLSFAQDQNNEMFKAIFDLASADTESYNAQGHKHHRSMSALTINQQA